LGARGILEERVLLPNGAITVVIDPEKVVVRPANNKKGYVITAHDGSGMRVMLPKAGYPQGYVVYFNNLGQPISPYSGRTGSMDEVHQHLNSVVPLP
jgi:hypothetical protein